MYLSGVAVSLAIVFSKSVFGAWLIKKKSALVTMGRIDSELSRATYFAEMQSN